MRSSRPPGVDDDRDPTGRRLTFAVAVYDERGLVAAGKVTRVIVDVDRFLDKAR